MLAFLSLALIAADAPTQAVWERALAGNAEYRRGEFVAAGLAPIEEAAASGREVRRLRTSVWLPGRPPAIELERDRAGRVTLRLAWRDLPAETHAVSRALWDELPGTTRRSTRRLNTIPNGSGRRQPALLAATATGTSKP